MKNNGFLTKWKLILSIIIAFGGIATGSFSAITFVDLRYAHADTAKKVHSQIKVQAKTSFIELRLSLIQSQLDEIALRDKADVASPYDQRRKQKLEQSLERLYQVQDALEQKAIQGL
jgi:hypothetical protein